MHKVDAEELREVIGRHEPDVLVEVVKCWWSSWYRVYVLRDGRRCEYQGVYHYWLERSLVETFCRPLDG